MLLAGEAAVGVGQPCGLQVGGGGAVVAEGEVAGGAAGNYASPTVIAHDTGTA